ncbi:tax1-binding protein 1 homolog [Uloborus diversus]|uniref:tax1-binding protein 1 homolog n=1 Tax=Uloborus diversus TaxID=327109 RepID=UPI002409CD3B|nr:tax1-binding protein 1 homolog [Uloborus diversus]
MDSVDQSEFLQSWFDLSKSDYAKVIFCDLYHSPEEGAVGCRFQITDNVHEDPCDYVGLFRVGYESLEQCIASKMLCETECEEDGKQLRCIFESEDLPDIDDGFYQFLYITRDNEVCGASMPFEIKKIAAEEASSDEDIVAEKGEEDINDFLVVRSNLVEKNRSLRALVDEYRSQNEALEAELKKLREEKEKAEKEDVITNLHQEIMCLSRQLSMERAKMDGLNCTVLKLTKQVELETKYKACLQAAKNKLSDDKEQLQRIIKEKDDALTRQIHTLGQDKNILLEQIEDSRTMIRALEDSKLLALREMNDLTKVIGERNKLLNELKRENDELKCRLDDEIAVNIKQKKLITELKCEHLALVLKLEETVTDNHMIKEEQNSNNDENAGKSAASVDSRKKEVESHRGQSVNNEETDSNIVDKDLKIAVQERIIEELKLHISSLMFQEDMKQIGVENVALDKNPTDCKHTSATSPEHAKLLAEINCYKQEIGVLKDVLKKKNEELEKITDENCNFQSNQLQLDEMVVDLKSHCAELRSHIADNESSISKLKEEGLKKDAVIEYLNGEKKEILTSQKNVCVTCDDMKARLKIAAELYRRQFFEIKKLKKKLQKAKNGSHKVDVLLQNSSASESCSEELPFVETFPGLACSHSSIHKPIRNSDSDTGEHVIGNLAGVPSNEKNAEFPKITWSDIRCLDPMNEDCHKLEAVTVRKISFGKAFENECCFKEVSAGTNNLYPVLSSLDHVQKNTVLADQHKVTDHNLSASSNISAECQTVPCAICLSPISSSSPDDMVLHLEKEHKQQMCPMCGKLFDMDLPFKYFLFHVEDHFQGN